MYISKKLFLMTALGLGINTSLYTAEYQSADSLLKFANSLDSISSKTTEPKDIAAWIRKTYYSSNEHDKTVTVQLINIVDDGTLSKSKIDAIKQIKAQEPAPQESVQGYLSNMSTFTKAAAAFIVAAGIASYFYFMHPWGSSNQ